MPRVLVTDKLASYGVAHRRLISSGEHRRSKYLNNRPRTLTSPPDSGNAQGNDSDPPVAPHGSCPRSAEYHRTADPTATDYAPTSTAKK